jgi:hypothetical protein
MAKNARKIRKNRPSGGLFLKIRDLDNVYLFPADRRSIVIILAYILKLYDAVHECKKGVVLAYTNIVTGKHLGATLADDNSAGLSLLAVTNFDPEILRVRVF